MSSVTSSGVRVNVIRAASDAKDPANDAPVITIDGPSGCGKSTLSRWLAGRLGWHLLDSGALYRVAAWMIIKEGHAAMDGARLASAVARQTIAFVPDNTPEAPCQVLVNGHNVTSLVRQDDFAAMASQLAADSDLRRGLMMMQRAYAKPPGLVTDGRDMGTVVFPQATFKLFLTADPAIRAQRRYHQLQAMGQDAKLDNLLERILERDERDAKRTVAPCKPATDAIVLDTSTMDFSSVASQALSLCAQHGLEVPDASPDITSGDVGLV